MSRGQELHDWGTREGLSADVIAVLLDKGFESLADLRHLSPDDVTERFEKMGHLPMPKCLALRNAIGRMSSGGPLPYPPQGRGYSSPDDQFQPGGPSSHGQQFEKERYTTHGPQYYEPGLSAAMEATSFGGGHSGPFNEEFRLLLVGKTGSGKSTTGNIIFGDELFQASADFNSVTAVCELKRSNKRGRKMEIMDSPGLFDTIKSNEEVGTVIIQSVAGMHPGPNAILYVVRVGRYTAEEYNAYTRLKALFDPSITRYMIVLFTGGDDLERKGQSIESLLPRLPDNLRTVLTECSHRYVLFNNFTRDPRPQVEHLFNMIRQLNRQNCVPYVCPKYGKIGESVEAEVARRMEEVDKKELERQKYVQKLQKQTEDTQQALRKIEEDMQRKEQEQKSEKEQLAKQQEQQMKLLKQQMEEQKLSDEKRLQEERALRERQQEEQQKMVKKMMEQERREVQRFQEMEEKRQRLEAELVQKEREMQEERGLRLEREMNNVKDEVVTDVLVPCLKGLVDVMTTGIEVYLKSQQESQYNDNYDSD